MTHLNPTILCRLSSLLNQTGMYKEYASNAQITKPDKRLGAKILKIKVQQKQALTFRYQRGTAYNLHSIANMHYAACRPTSCTSGVATFSDDKNWQSITHGISGLVICLSLLYSMHHPVLQSYYA